MYAIWRRNRNMRGCYTSTVNRALDMILYESRNLLGLYTIQRFKLQIRVCMSHVLMMWGHICQAHGQSFDLLTSNEKDLFFYMM